MATTQTRTEAFVSITAPAGGAPVFTSNITVSGSASALRITTSIDDDGLPDEQTVILPIVKVEVRLGSGAFTQASPGSGGSFSQWSFTAQTPPGPSQLAVTARMTYRTSPTGTATATATDSITVKLDTTGPVTTVNTPLAGQLVPLPTTAPDAQVSLAVTGTVSDTESGVNTVTVAVGTGSPVTAARTGASWNATVTLQAPPGPRTIVVRATDNRNNTTTTSVPVDLAAPFTAPDPDRLLSTAAYLSDLLAFAALRVAGGQAGTTALRTTFCQRFDLAPTPAAAPAATATVTAARVAVEVLRDYLQRRTTLTGALLAQRNAADRRFLRAAYRAVLREFGTSTEQLRAARTAGAGADARAALAARLGVETLTIAELDALALDPDTVTGAQLEDVYGIVDTARDPYAAPARPVPLLLERQLTGVHNRWQREDDAAGVPIVDPDLLGAADIPVGGAAAPLRAARRAQVDAELTARRTQLQTALGAPGATHATVFAALVDAGLGTGLGTGAAAALAALADDEKKGLDVAGSLATLHLDLAAFRRLLAVRALAAANAVRQNEWDDVVAICVAARKRREFYPAWRAQESGLWLGPDHFHIASPPVRLDSLAPWLATPSARAAWEATLRARVSELRAVRAAFAAAGQAADRASLPRLRDDLVAVVGAARPPGASPAGPFDAARAADALTDELMVDFAAAGTAPTTRLDQAVETLQGILFAVRTRRLATAFAVLGANPAAGAAGWALTAANGYTEALFDEEWRFLGTQGTWRGAMSVFAWPENVLAPTLRPPLAAGGPPRATGSTASFRALADRVRANLGLTPAQARAEAAAYLAALREEFPANATPTLPAALRDDSLVQVTDQLGDAQLAHRRDVLLATGTVAGATGTAGQHYALFTPSGTANTTFADTRVWLAEVFFFVPMLLAQQLEKSGQHLAALGWVRTVYAHDLPTPAARKIYRGLRLEEPPPAGAPPIVRSSTNWLLGNGMQPHELAINRPGAHTRATVLTLARLLLAFAEDEFALETPESLPRARTLFDAVADALDASRVEFTPQLDGNGVGLAPNPALTALRERAGGGLAKLRAGVNPLGLERGISRRPTPYRFAVLLDRAQKLVATAQQMEDRFLAAAEKADAEAYNLLRARQDVALARAGVTLQDLRVAEAVAGVELGTLQRAGALVRREHAQTLLDRATGVGEKAAVAAAGVRAAIAVAGAVPGIGGVAGAFFDVAGQLALRQGAAAVAGSGIGGAVAALADFTGAAVSYERAREDLTVALALADNDVAIADAQAAVAELHVGVVEQERRISAIQFDHAQATLDFLATKFTNAELYEWMAGILGDIYRYFLRQAGVVARLAERQLRFERQEELPEFIRADYWEPVADASGAGGGGGGGGGAAGGPNRRGLTGAEQLLRDLTQLDQYAFTTDRRRLQLSRTFSLASADPLGFEQFRRSGVLVFATPSQLFDRDFPGHYARLVRRVRTTVVALIPPARGIRATLRSAGTSRVVVPGDGGFTTVTVAHGPEEVALSAPLGATGLFELDAQPELRPPFEGFGVDTTWELRLPRPANPFDFATLFDVLVTIEYTALDSPVLRDEVVRTLDARVGVDRTFSVRSDLPDAWFDLANPDQTATPMRMRFTTGRADFPPNLDELRIAQILVYAAGRDGRPVEVTVDALAFTPAATPGAAGPPPAPLASTGPATTVDGIASTRRGNGAPWRPLLGATPFGAWELALRDTQELRNLFKDGEVDDLLFVLTVDGRTPPWPS